MGFRDREYAIPKPVGTFRLVCLGDSYTLGVGVRQEDTFPKKLEMQLNRSRRDDDPDFEVVNCGVSGYDTRQERLSYEVFASKYAPDLVLISMVSNDDRAWYEDLELGYYHYPTAFERLSGMAYLLSKYRYRRPPPDYSRSVSELQKLAALCRGDGAQLAVFIFQTSLRKEWSVLERSVRKGMLDTGIPVYNLGPVLLSGCRPIDLQVSRYDRHPNHIAHKKAADEILNQLRSFGLLSHNSNLDQ